VRELAALNQFFWKYRFRFFIGMLLVIATNYLAVLAPQITGYVVGLVQAKTDLSNTTFEEKITSAQIGYNLGPVAIAAAVSKVTDVAASSTAGTDSKEIQFRITTAF
jgi:ABC-type multidrug transport system fused ATPase/permease subunit